MSVTPGDGLPAAGVTRRTAGEGEDPDVTDVAMQTITAVTGVTDMIEGEQPRSSLDAG